ncbi:MAG: hypothetical protein J0I14_05805 [Propionibacteriaceae bacterium]|nr:hypothetical protein [Propionibacteriaceae bacterium]
MPTWSLARRASSFSPYDGHRSMLRLPIWHEAELLHQALGLVAAADRRRARE